MMTRNYFIRPPSGHCFGGIRGLIGLSHEILNINMRKV
eukprot:UN22558